MDSGYKGQGMVPASSWCSVIVSSCTGLSLDICPPEPLSQPISAHHQTAHPKPHLLRALKCLCNTKGTSERRSCQDVDGGGCFFRTKDWDTRSRQLQVNIGTSQCWKVSSPPCRASPLLTFVVLPITGVAHRDHQCPGFGKWTERDISRGF